MDDGLSFFVHKTVWLDYRWVDVGLVVLKQGMVSYPRIDEMLFALPSLQNVDMAVPSAWSRERRSGSSSGIIPFLLEVLNESRGDARG